MTKKTVLTALHLLCLALIASGSVALADPGTGGGTGLKPMVPLGVTAPGQ